MTTRLDPPPVPPLSPSQRARLRNHVMDATDPVRRPHRRWAAPVIAVAAVGAIVAGTLAIGDQTQTPDQASPPAGATNTGVPEAIKLDVGPVSAAAAAAAAKRCQPGAPKAEALWSRQVRIPADKVAKTPARTDVVVLTKTTPGQPDGTYDLGLSVCFAKGLGAAIPDSHWQKIPTPAQGLVTLAGFGMRGIPSDGIPPAGQAWGAEFQSLHRVRKEIVRIQSRYVWQGGEGPWYEGVVQGGFAYTASFVAYAAGQYSPTPQKPNDKTLSSPGVQQEFRAFDSLGNPVPLQY